MKAKHLPCSCGCGELADECMSGGPALAAFTMTPLPCRHCNGWGTVETGKRITGEHGRKVARVCGDCNGSGAELP